MELACTGLTRNFGTTRALRDVSLQLSPGVLAAVVGPNGAGKSTLVRILATLILPDSGTFRLGELDSRKQALRLRRHIGYLGHESMLDGALTVHENLRLFAGLYGAPRTRVDELLARFDAQALGDKPVSSLSRGQEQTAGLCRALLHDPALLLLDEPSTGLDENAQARLWAAAREHAAAGNIVIFTTHDATAAAAAPRLIELKEGCIVRQAG